MSHRNLREAIDDLAATRQLVRIDEPIDPRLEAAEIHRRVFRAGGPAVLYSKIKDCQFPMASNLFGTIERARYLFRDSLDAVRRLIGMRLDPAVAWKRPWRAAGATRAALAMRPRMVTRAPVLARQTTIDRLPQQVSWPLDAGAFITLPLVYTEDPDRPGWSRSNLGMYRVQLSGGQYEPNREVGLHYQIHRGIGPHHAAALRRGEPLRVSIHVGGSPAMILSAVMPLPEGMSELSFAGALGGQRVPLLPRVNPVAQALGVRVYKKSAQPSIYAEADFVITGTVESGKLLPEGPFGDHLGYYSLAHDFPVLRVDAVYHREGAIWPFTVVGRPPQEDTIFGQLIHELTGPIIPTVIAGVQAVHAVDAAGVHPLLLAIGSERYVPYAERTRPQELLTQANAILGQGQLSLAKYLFIVAREDNPQLDIHRVDDFLRHLLERVDWQRDLHFQTCTTIDTLDYSGSALNEGSKVVIAAVGPPRRALPTQIPSDLRLPPGFSNPRVCLPGVLTIQVAGNPSPFGRGKGEGKHDWHGVPHPGPLPEGEGGQAAEQFCSFFSAADPINAFPLIVLVDDSEFTAASLGNFLWVTFTRSNPAPDVHGIGSFIDEKHWGCRGALVIDARIKLHHAPPLEPDPEVARRVDRLFASGGPLSGIKE